MDTVRRIEAYLEELFREERFSHCFPLQVVLAPGNKIRVFIDADEGVTLKACQEVSRALENRLDTDGSFGDSYTLEVSSPGTDRPLTQWRQYAKHRGRTLEVQMQNGSRVTGTLTSLGDGTLYIEQENAKEKHKTAIPFDEVRESVVQIRFK